MRSRISWDSFFLPTRSFTREIRLQYLAEAGTVPAGHGLRRDDDERTLPSGPEPVREHPEEFVQGADLWVAVLAFQYSELLPERQVLQEQCAMRTKATSQ